MHSRPKKKTPDDYELVSIRLTPLLRTRIDRLADRTGQSVSSVARDAVAAGMPALEQAVGQEVAS